MLRGELPREERLRPLREPASLHSGSRAVSGNQACARFCRAYAGAIDSQRTDFGKRPVSWARRSSHERKGFGARLDCRRFPTCGWGLSKAELLLERVQRIADEVGLWVKRLVEAAHHPSAVQVNDGQVDVAVAGQRSLTHASHAASD